MQPWLTFHFDKIYCVWHSRHYPFTKTDLSNKFGPTQSRRFGLSTSIRWGPVVLSCVQTVTWLLLYRLWQRRTLVCLQQSVKFVTRWELLGSKSLDIRTGSSGSCSSRRGGRFSMRHSYSTLLLCRNAKHRQRNACFTATEEGERKKKKINQSLFSSAVFPPPFSG